MKALPQSLPLMGAEYKTTHEFKSCDTIAAEMMNELFENIRGSKTFSTPKVLVGTWTCGSTVLYTSTANSNKASVWMVNSDDFSL